MRFLNELAILQAQMENMTGIKPDAVALHPETWTAVGVWARATMLMYPDTTGAPQSLMGMAVYPSPLVPRGTAYVATVREIETMLGTARESAADAEFEAAAPADIAALRAEVERLRAEVEHLQAELTIYQDMVDRLDPDAL